MSKSEFDSASREVASSDKSTPQHSFNVNIDEAALLRRIDLRLLPPLILLYLFAFLDRINIGNAQVFGLSKELGLKGTEFNVALCIFFIPYIIFDIPANALLKVVSPNILLGGCMFMFGIVTIAQGFVTSYGGLLTTRFFLGFFEAGVFPGCFYLLSTWYRREESQKRFTAFFMSTALGGAFGGLLASGIGKMDGTHGKLAWRWIFIIEGVMTCVVALIGFMFLPAFPEEVKWLNEEERAFVTERLRKDVGDSGKNERAMRPSDLLVLLKDFKFLLCGLLYFTCLVPLYGYSYFSPTIINAWKISPIETQLRGVPIWVVSGLVAIIAAYFSDRTKSRYPFICVLILPALAGFLMLLCGNDLPVETKYGALFLANTGIFAATPITICWFNSNLAGHNNKALGSAVQIAFGNAGGILATFLFLQKQAPKYTTGYSICIGSLVLCFFVATTYYAACRMYNRNVDKDAESGKIKLML